MAATLWWQAWCAAAAAARRHGRWDSRRRLARAQVAAAHRSSSRVWLGGVAQREALISLGWGVLVAAGARKAWQMGLSDDAIDEANDADDNKQAFIALLSE